MQAWLDGNSTLWLQLEGQRAVRCRDLSKTQLVVICEELDLTPVTARDQPSFETMVADVRRYFDFGYYEVGRMDDDLLEFYWEWSHVSRADIYRALYEHLCSLNIIDANCAVDQATTHRLPSISAPVSASVSPVNKPGNRRYQPLRLPSW